MSALSLTRNPESIRRALRQRRVASHLDFYYPPLGMRRSLVFSGTNARALTMCRLYVSVLLFSNDFGEFVYNGDAAPMGFDEQRLAVGALVNENNNFIFHAALPNEVLRDKTPLTLQIGARAYFAAVTEPDDDIVGLAFGARAPYKLPFDNVPVLREFPLYLIEHLLRPGKHYLGV